MKLFGTITKLASIKFLKNGQDILLSPSQSTTYTAARSFELPPGNSDHIIVSASSVQTLTNKAFDSSSTFTGVTLTLSGDPVAALDPATKQYVDNAFLGLKWKDAVRAVAASNITLSGAQTIDGVAVIAGDRVGVIGQTTGAQNGIYVAASGGWTRSTDADTGTKIFQASFFASEGTIYGDTQLVCTTNAPITIGTTALAFVQGSGGSSINAGVGLDKTGNTLSVRLGAGLTELPTGEAGIDLYTSSGLLLTLDGTTSSTATGAQLAVMLNGSTLSRSSGGVKVADGGINDLQVNSAAAIAGTKVSPNFGSQAVTTTSVGTLGSLILTDTTATGFIELAFLGINHAAAPAAGVRLYSTVAANRLYMKGTNGFETILDSSLLSANRSFKFPDGPSSADTLVTNNSNSTLANKTLTTPVISSISNTGTLTLPTSTDTLVGRDTVDTLTNKTFSAPVLTSPVISTITNTGTLTLPTSTDTLVGRATTDTLTNKTIAAGSNTITGLANANIATAAAIAGTKISPDFGSQTVVSTGAASFGLLTTTGPGGYLELGASTASTAAATGNVKLFAGSINALSMYGQAGFKLILNFNGFTADHSWAFPDLSDTFVGLTSAQTLTNKTINASSNTISNIADANIAAAAAIAGSKISPNFVAQNVVTTGSVSGTSLIASGTGTSGFVQIAVQSGTPASVSGSVLIYTTGSQGLVWRTDQSATNAIVPVSTSVGVVLTMPTASTTIVGTTSTQTLTNKTMAFASNTFNLTALGDIFYGGAAGAGTILSGNTAATKKLLTQIGTGSVSAAPIWNQLDDIAYFASAILVGSGTKLLTDTTPVFSNGRTTTYFDYNEIAIPSVPPNPFRRTYFKNDNNMYWLDSNSIEMSVNATGTGEKNYAQLAGYYVQATALGWNVNNGTPTNSTNTSAIPRASSKYGIQYISSAASSGDYIRYRFQIDNADLSKKLKLKFSQQSPNGNYQVQVWYGTDSALTGATQLTMSTDAAGVSNLPATILGLDYQTTFDTNINGFYEIRWVAVGASRTIRISDIVVGPGILAQGAAVSDLISYTPVVTGVGTPPVATYFYRRNGSYMDITAVFTCGTVTGSNVTIPLPPGLTVNSLLGSTATFGRWHKGVATATTKKGGPLFAAAGATALSFSYDDTSTASSPFTVQGGTTLFNNSEVVSLYATSIPINEWAGSGTVNVVQNDVEYASNSSTADANDISAFAYGPNGSLVPTITAAVAGASPTARAKRVSFNTPISATDRIELQLQITGTGSWINIENSSDYQPLQRQRDATNNNLYGVYITYVTSTTVDVNFGKAGATTGNTNYATAGIGYPSNAGDRWRVRKMSGGQPIGFSNVAQSTSGLVKSAGQLQGTNTNDDAATGFVGEYLQNYRTSSVSLTSATWCSIDTGNIAFNDNNEVGITLTAGDWDLQGHIFFVGAAGTTASQAIVSIGTAKGPSITGVDSNGANYGEVQAALTAPVRQSVTTPTWRVSISSTTTYYLKANVTFAVNAMTAGGILRARRVR